MTAAATPDSTTTARASSARSADTEGGAPGRTTDMMSRHTKSLSDAGSRDPSALRSSVRCCEPSTEVRGLRSADTSSSSVRRALVLHNRSRRSSKTCSASSSPAGSAPGREVSGAPAGASAPRAAGAAGRAATGSSATVLLSATVLVVRVAAPRWRLGKTRARRAGLAAESRGRAASARRLLAARAACMAKALERGRGAPAPVPFGQLPGAVRRTPRAAGAKTSSAGRAARPRSSWQATQFLAIGESGDA